MKKCISVLLVFFLFALCLVTETPKTHAVAKASQSRSIAIVFDNSGSMYLDGKQDWCRATYAMEVFAAMLNKGDVLTIYPMWPIEVEGKTYTMESPLKITDSSQSSEIRKIYSPEAKGTPIETIDFAANGLKASKADKKYMIVLTDGDSFYLNGVDLKGKTKGELDKRFKVMSGPDMTVMYLGVGKQTVIPDTPESDYFVKKHAKNSEDVLSSLTDMCNQIFGRDTLPKKRINGKKIDFDISMNKVIVFVQGKNVSDVKVTGANGLLGTQAGVTSTKYSTKGTGRCKSVPDTTLQGMMVTYTDCAAGNYNIDYKGDATSIEVYYEPNADLDFVFTDAEGNDVDPNELYEGEYKVSFGMKDGKTGQLIKSDLLGKPHYQGSYYINGQEVPIKHDGLSGEVPISLKMNDAFDAKLTATYLGGYTISKDTTDFGWPKGGIKVAARPAGNLRLEITGGERLYYLQKLGKGEPYIAKVYYQDKQLTGKELEKVKLTWDANKSNAGIKAKFAQDHYDLILDYKDPKSPKETVCGNCKVMIEAVYAAPGSDEAKARRPLTYMINEDISKLKMNLVVPQDYIVIDELEESEAIEAKFYINGEPLTPEEFARLKLEANCDKIKYTVTPNEKKSSYSIKLKPTDRIGEGKYPIDISAVYTDFVGRTSDVNSSTSITLSHTPLWLKWLIGILLFILLILIIWRIMRIRVLPSAKILHKHSEKSLRVNGKEVDKPNLSAKRNGKKLVFKATYCGNNFIVNISSIEPGKESYLSKPQVKRSILINPKNVSKVGTINYVDVAGVGFKTDKNGKLAPDDENQKPFTLRNNSIVAFDGNVEENGRTKKFHAEIPLTFKKK